MEYGHEKPEVTAVSIDPNFSSYLYNEYLSSISNTKLYDDIFLGRYFPDLMLESQFYFPRLFSLLDIISQE
jgi:hypothetical protein